MRAFNLGCGPEIFENGYEGYEWRNVDSTYKHENVENIDLRYDKPLVGEGYDFALVNHVLCTMRPEEVDMFLKNVHSILKQGGWIQVIDVDVMKAFGDYLMNDGDGLPIQDRDKDYNLCMHLSGYGTRLSLYTPKRMEDVLSIAGFGNIRQVLKSAFNTRPKESLVFEAQK